MTIRALRALSLSAALTASWIFPASASSLSAFSDLVVFGASTVDAGRVSAASDMFGFDDPTEGPGFGGQGRFTNDADGDGLSANFADQISQELFGTATLASDFGGNNFAFGGATGISNGGGPDLLEQVGEYIASGIDTSALHLFDFGGNDAVTIASNPESLADSVAAFGASFNTAFSTLIDMGASEFLVSLVPSVSLTPGIIFADSTDFPGIADFSDTVVAALNSELSSQIYSLASQANFFVFSPDDAFAPLEADPAFFGVNPFALENGISCQSQIGVTVGEDCFGFAFIDDIHFVEPLHTILADAAIDSLASPVPLPGAAWLMLSGLGVLGLRRRFSARP